MTRQNPADAGPLRLHTPRLVLTAATPATLRAESGDRSVLADLLEASVPGDWPPPLYDDAARRYTLARLEEDPGAVGWWPWYIVRRLSGELIGLAGFKGRPSPSGEVEVGYSLLPRHRRQGFATESVQALIGWACEHPEVQTVAAETLPELAPSIRVLERCGFAYAGPSNEPGAIRYRLARR